MQAEITIPRKCTISRVHGSQQRKRGSAVATTSVMTKTCAWKRLSTNHSGGEIEVIIGIDANGQ